MLGSLQSWGIACATLTFPSGAFSVKRCAMYSTAWMQLDKQVRATWGCLQVTWCTLSSHWLVLYATHMRAKGVNCTAWDGEIVYVSILQVGVKLCESYIVSASNIASASKIAGASTS